VRKTGIDFEERTWPIEAARDRSGLWAFEAIYIDSQTFDF
jgi:hypothetical protein